MALVKIRKIYVLDIFISWKTLIKVLKSSNKISWTRNKSYEKEVNVNANFTSMIFVFFPTFLFYLCKQ